MIDWTQATNGKFEALVSSISITCADPTAATSNATGYIYGTDATAKTPTVSFSSASTLLDGTSTSTSSGKMAKLAKEIGIAAGVIVFLLIVAALIIRSCMMNSRKKARTTGHAANIAAGLTSGQSYRPVNGNGSMANLETHSMPNRGYQGQNQYNVPPSPQYGRSPYGGGPQYPSQPQFHRY